MNASSLTVDVRDRNLYGLLAEFATADALLGAASAARAAGYRHAEAYAPFHIEGLAERLGMRRNHVALASLLGGIAGGVGGYFLQWYAAVIDYPINVGGRPLHSWPLFVPASFELTILGAALAAVLSMLVANGLPQLYHPIFNARGFDMATRNRFFLCLRRDDPNFEYDNAVSFLNGLSPLQSSEVPR